MTTTASASGKVILFGEHAVVYGRPAIAAPIHDLRAWASVSDGPPGQGSIVEAPDLRRTVRLDDAQFHDPLAVIVRATLDHLHLDPQSDLTVTVRSDIPIARGLGSGAAVSAAIVRSIALHAGLDISPQQVSVLVYEAESLYHGTPSGIDNTVIALERPIYFALGNEPQPLDLGCSLALIIADTGETTSTSVVVEDVRRAWLGDSIRFNAFFDKIGAISDRARKSLSAGDLRNLGSLMNENQVLLSEIGVSSPELERLCHSANQTGARGSKLSGGGRGGITISLVTPEVSEQVSDALRSAGAVWIKSCQIHETMNENPNGSS